MIILASKSPRRIELLKALGLDFKVMISHANEEIDDKICPSEHVKIIAERKTNIDASLDDIVIAADTIVYVNNEIWGKPKDEAEAYQMLSTLSGNSCEVYTGVCIKKGSKIYSDYVKSIVYFAELSENEIQGYIKTGEPFDKAGGFGAQGIGMALISHINGDFYNVMGLPVRRLCEMLKKEFNIELLSKEGQNGDKQ